MNSSKTKIKIKKPKIPMVSVSITREALFPNLDNSRRHREEQFIANYADSHYSGSYHLPPNRSEFEYLWSNHIVDNRRLTVEYEDGGTVPYDQLGKINLKDIFCKYPKTYTCWYIKTKQTNHI